MDKSNFSCYFLLSLLLLTPGCKKTAKDDTNYNGKANMNFVSEQIESDDFRWYKYKKNYGTDSCEMARVDQKGNFLTRIFNVVEYEDHLGNNSMQGFHTAIKMKDPIFGYDNWGAGFIDMDNIERLYPEYGCYFGATRLGEQFLMYDAPLEYYIETSRFCLEKNSRKSVYHYYGCYDKQWNLILLPIYDEVIYSIGGKYTDDDDDIEERFCVKYHGKWYSTNYKLDKNGIKEIARHPEKKGVYRYSYYKNSENYSWEGELLCFKDYICLFRTIPGASDYKALFKYHLTDNNDGIRKYKRNDKSYYEYDEGSLEGDIFYVIDYYDNEGEHVYIRAKLYETNNDEYSSLRKYEEAYKNYFSEIDKLIAQNGYVRSDERCELFNRLVKSELPHKTYDNSPEISSIPIHPTQPINSGGNNLGSGSYDVNSQIGNTTNQQRERKWRDCSHCRGKGTVIRESHVGTYGVDDPMVYCAECGRSWYRSTGHSHVSCPICHGDRGFWSE